MKLKIMPLDKYEEVFNLNWVPLELAKHDMPDWLKGLPETLLHRMMISGSFIDTYAYQSERIPSGSLIGGLDVYRNAPEDPVELNKDWYALVRNPQDENTILVDGPFIDAEHWLDAIPKRLENIEMFAVSKKISADSD